jgi:hypothetical protein
MNLQMELEQLKNALGDDEESSESDREQGHGAAKDVKGNADALVEELRLLKAALAEETATVKGWRESTGPGGVRDGRVEGTSAQRQVVNKAGKSIKDTVRSRAFCPDRFSLMQIHILYILL